MGIDMANGIIFEAAECDPHCDVPDCPYMHSPSWFVGDVSFQTLPEAEVYAAEAEKTERQLQTGLDAITNRS